MPYHCMHKLKTDVDSFTLLTWESDFDLKEEKSFMRMQGVLAACSHVHFHLTLCLLIGWTTSLGHRCQAIITLNRHFA